MKTTTKVLLAGVLLAASSAPLVADAAVSFDVNIGVPGYSYYSPAPASAYYPPVYYSTPRAFYRERDWRRERDHRYVNRRFDHRRHW